MNSQALFEVWEWKECAYQEVASLPIDIALKKRLDDSMRSVRELGFTASAKRLEPKSIRADHVSISA